MTRRKTSHHQFLCTNKPKQHPNSTVRQSLKQHYDHHSINEEEQENEEAEMMESSTVELTLFDKMCLRNVSVDHPILIGSPDLQRQSIGQLASEISPARKKKKRNTNVELGKQISGRRMQVQQQEQQKIKKDQQHKQNKQEEKVMQLMSELLTSDKAEQQDLWDLFNQQLLNVSSSFSSFSCLSTSKKNTINLVQFQSTLHGLLFDEEKDNDDESQMDDISKLFVERVLDHFYQQNKQNNPKVYVQSCQDLIVSLWGYQDENIPAWVLNWMKIQLYQLGQSTTDQKAPTNLDEFQLLKLMDLMLLLLKQHPPTHLSNSSGYLTRWTELFAFGFRLIGHYNTCFTNQNETAVKNSTSRLTAQYLAALSLFLTKNGRCNNENWLRKLLFRDWTAKAPLGCFYLGLDLLSTLLIQHPQEYTEMSLKKLILLIGDDNQFVAQQSLSLVEFGGCADWFYQSGYLKKMSMRLYEISKSHWAPQIRESADRIFDQLLDYV